MNKVYLLLGGNIGDVKANFNTAEKLLNSINCKIITKSSIYVTQAWGVKNQPDFLNQVFFLETELHANSLLLNLLTFEKKIGRNRENAKKWRQRAIDIDILFFNDEVINTPPALIVPHPYLHERKFTLTPLVEIAPEWMHPLLKKSNSALLKECKDTLEVKKQVFL